MEAAPAVQVIGRAGVALVALGLYALWATRRRGHGWRERFALSRPELGIAVLYAISSAAFLYALTLTSVAHVLFMQSATSLVAALLARAFLGEAVPPRTVLAMLGAGAGLGIMVLGSDEANTSLLGDALGGLVAVSFGATIVLMRQARPGTEPISATLAQLLVVCGTLPFALGALGTLVPGDVPLMIGVGIFQMFLGMIMFGAGARLIPAAQSSLISLVEVVLGPVLVWLVYAERPGVATIVGGALLLVTLVAHTVADVQATRDGHLAAAAVS